MSDVMQSLLNIWTRPRATIRHQMELGKSKTPFLIALFAGLTVLSPYLWSAIAISEDAPLGLNQYPLASALLAAIAGPLLGIVYLFFFGWIYFDTCRFLGGTATQPAVRLAIAWSLAPMIVAVLISQSSAFSLAFACGFLGVNDSTGEAVVDLLVVLPLVIGYHWSLFILFKGLGEVSGFSFWKGWGATIFGRGYASVILLIPAIVGFFIYAAIYV